MPTGGITPENISGFKKAGAVAFGIGTSLVDARHKITEESLKRITENARKFVQAIAALNRVNGFRLTIQGIQEIQAGSLKCLVCLV